MAHRAYGLPETRCARARPGLPPHCAVRGAPRHRRALRGAVRIGVGCSRDRCRPHSRPADGDYPAGGDLPRHPAAPAVRRRDVSAERPATRGGRDCAPRCRSRTRVGGGGGERRSRRRPALRWAAAATLGAIVAATDTDAALWAMRSIPLARVVEAVLEGEGLLNDEAAVVAYRIAVAAAVGMAISVSHAVVGFFGRMIGGIALGWIVATLAMQAHRRTRSLPVVASTVSLLTPYARYRRRKRRRFRRDCGRRRRPVFGSPRPAAPRSGNAIVHPYDVGGRDLHCRESDVRSVGLELPNVTRALDRWSLAALLRVAALVVASLVVVRMVWVFVGAYVFRGTGQRLRGRRPTLIPVPQVAFVAWAGLRGSDSLVLALSLPLTTAAAQPFPARDAIIFITFCVVVISLVIQGPTLAPLAERLDVFRDAIDDREEAHARVVASRPPSASWTIPPSRARSIARCCGVFAGDRDCARDAGRDASNSCACATRARAYTTCVRRGRRRARSPIDAATSFAAYGWKCSAPSAARCWPCATARRSVTRSCGASNASSISRNCSSGPKSLARPALFVDSCNSLPLLWRRAVCFRDPEPCAANARHVLRSTLPDPLATAPRPPRRLRDAARHRRGAVQRRSEPAHRAGGVRSSPRDRGRRGARARSRASPPRAPARERHRPDRDARVHSPPR